MTAAAKMIEFRLEPAGAAAKYVIRKPRLSMLTHEVFFLQPCGMCAKECILHCEGKCTEDKVQII